MRTPARGAAERVSPSCGRPLHACGTPRWWRAPHGAALRAARHMGLSKPHVYAHEIRSNRLPHSVVSLDPCSLGSLEETAASQLPIRLILPRLLNLTSPAIRPPRSWIDRRAAGIDAFGVSMKRIRLWQIGAYQDLMLCQHTHSACPAVVAAGEIRLLLVDNFAGSRVAN